jgi:hypothetical protein
VSATVNPIVDGLGASLLQTSGQLLTPPQDEESVWTDRQISNVDSDQIRGLEEDHSSIVL